MAEMVWCVSCKKVVWAYDHQRKVDLRGICNMLRLPCPQCGVRGSFDGWGSNEPMAQLERAQVYLQKEKIYDSWSAMKYIARSSRVEWCPSPNNEWFRKGHNEDIPDHELVWDDNSL